MTPPESYLDPTTSVFDLSLLHTYPEWKETQPDFTYHGHNTYAYLLAKFANTTTTTNGISETVPTFDFVAI